MFILKSLNISNSNTSVVKIADLDIDITSMRIYNVNNNILEIYNV